MGSLSHKMPWKAFSQPPRCPACATPVFANEAYMAADRTPFHRTCVKCDLCTKPLTPGEINEHEKHLYCRVCYESNLAPKANYSPRKKKMQVLPVKGVFKVESKPVEEEGPTPEELKHRELEEARAKAWAEATAKTSSVSSSLMKVEELLSMGL